MFILKRTVSKLFRAVLLLLAVSIITFTMIEVSPIDPVDAYVGEVGISAEKKAQIEEYWGLNESPVKRYISWISNILHGNLGTSMIYRKPVIRVIGERFELSIWLMVSAWLLSGIIGLFLGVLVAIYKDSLLARLIKIYCLLLESAPAFWIGMILLLFFSVKLKLFPMGLASPVGIEFQNATLPQKIQHLVLPTLTLGLTGISKITLQISEKLRQILESDYVLFARSRGESIWQVIIHHGLRNTLLPFVTLQFGSISELFGGSVLAETVFTYPGLGNVTVQSALKGDMALFLGITLFSALFVFFGNLIADVLYAAIDPQIREASVHEK